MSPTAPRASRGGARARAFFHCIDDTGKRRSIDSGDVNDYLREISGVDERDAPVEAPARVPALGPDTRSRRHRALDTRLAVLMLRRQRFLLFRHESLRRGEAAALSKQEATRRRS
jgi:hypothetical protein